MGTNYYLVPNRPTAKKPLHIGKASCGWKFNFYKPYNYEVDVSLNTFEQWRDYLKEVTTAKTHVIIDEYDRIITLEELLETIAEKQKEDNPEDFKYSENVNGYRFTSVEFS